MDFSEVLNNLFTPANPGPRGWPEMSITQDRTLGRVRFSFSEASGAHYDGLLELVALPCGISLKVDGNVLATFDRTDMRSTKLDLIKEKKGPQLIIFGHLDTVDLDRCDRTGTQTLITVLIRKTHNQKVGEIIIRPCGRVEVKSEENCLAMVN